MRDHEDCESEIAAALARGREGFAEYLATRCDRHHGELAHPTPDDHPTTHPEHEEQR